MTRKIAIGVAAFALFIALRAQAQTTKWDQAAVTAAAAEYETAVTGLRDAVRKSTAWSMTANRSKLYQITQDLRQIEWLAQSLHADLAKGDGLEATTPEWNEILERREYAKADAMFVDITDFIRPKLEAARAAQTKLSAYYPTAPKP
jgi:LmbE family N-acetylglucosaminyl deacetylase